MKPKAKHFFCSKKGIELSLTHMLSFLFFFFFFFLLIVAPQQAELQPPPSKVAATPFNFDNIPNETLTMARIMESPNVPQFFVSLDVEVDSLLEVISLLQGFISSISFLFFSFSFSLKPNLVLNTTASKEKVSVGDFLIRAATAALASHPELNSVWNSEGVLKKQSAIHVSVIKERHGIPVTIPNAENKSVAAIAEFLAVFCFLFLSFFFFTLKLSNRG